MRSEIATGFGKSRRIVKAAWGRGPLGRLQITVYPIGTMADMGLSSSHEVTQLLRAWTAGDQDALEKLTPLLYEQLHRVAQRYMAGQRPGHTLQTTALVNEVYLRLVDCSRVDWQDRAHFLAVSARLMRRILIDFARSRGYQKRGGGAVHLSLDDAPSVSNEPDADIVALDDALKALAEVDGRKSKVVELKFFGGLSIEETAEVLKVSTETVVRDWRLARAWLLRELSGEA
jgi:RNA polymerase sigma-70 factor (ECF subfamily)